jgi:hypothetical protein
MSTLASVIESAANAFAKEIIAAVKGATLQEMLTLQGGVAPRRGRPPTPKPDRKPGRPPKATTAKKAAKAQAKKRRKIAWPKCKHRGCKKNAWRRGKGYCGEHYKAKKGKK